MIALRIVALGSERHQHTQAARTTSDRKLRYTGPPGSLRPSRHVTPASREHYCSAVGNMLCFTGTVVRIADASSTMPAAACNVCPPAVAVYLSCIYKEIANLLSHQTLSTSPSATPKHTFLLQRSRPPALCSSSLPSPPVFSTARQRPTQDPQQQQQLGHHRLAPGGRGKV